jgi:predicted glutamine amidotransferase
MCVIVVANTKTQFPKIETIEKCMETNPDGAGFMYIGYDKGVHIAKGFFKPEEVMARIETVPDESPIVFHSRIATHGKVSKENCHPFPVTLVDDALKLCNLRCRMGFAHNGVFSGYTAKVAQSGFPDSVEFMRHLIYPVYKDLKRESVQFLLSELVGSSRVAILSSDNLYLFGTFIEEDGVKYSNSSWKYGSRRYTYSNKGKKGFYVPPYDYTSYLDPSDGLFEKAGEGSSALDKETTAMTSRERRIQSLLAFYPSMSRKNAEDWVNYDVDTEVLK